MITPDLHRLLQPLVISLFIKGDLVSSGKLEFISKFLPIFFPNSSREISPFCFSVDDVSEPNSPIRSRSNSNTATLLSGAAAVAAAGGKPGLPMIAQMDAVIPAAAPAAPQLPIIHTDVNQVCSVTQFSVFLHHRVSS